MTQGLAILPFGSLIDDPGAEIEPLVCERIQGIETPFCVEFARSSASRHGAPTLVPVESGGSPVRAVLLVLKEDVSKSLAETVLWRRETRKEGSGKEYSAPKNPGPNHVLVKSHANLEGIGTVLSTYIAANIDDLSSDRLADFAIESARRDAGRKFRDGISYLNAA